MENSMVVQPQRKDVLAAKKNGEPTKNRDAWHAFEATTEMVNLFQEEHHFAAS